MLGAMPRGGIGVGVLLGSCSLKRRESGSRWLAEALAG